MMSKNCNSFLKGDTEVFLLKDVPEVGEYETDHQYEFLAYLSVSWSLES